MCRISRASSSLLIRTTPATRRVSAPELVRPTTIARRSLHPPTTFDGGRGRSQAISKHGGRERPIRERSTRSALWGWGVRQRSAKAAKPPTGLALCTTSHPLNEDVRWLLNAGRALMAPAPHLHIAQRPMSTFSSRGLLATDSPEIRAEHIHGHPPQETASYMRELFLARWARGEFRAWLPTFRADTP